MSCDYIIKKTHTYGELSVIDYALNKNVDEDIAYMEPYLQKILPRGKSEVYFNDKLIHSLVGSNKFGDETEKYGKKCDDWSYVVSTEKLNGECFHLSFFKHQTFPYALLGSKQVHFPICCNGSIEDQITNIEKEQGERVSYGVKMARCFFSKYFDKSSELIEFCCENKVTLVGEYINPLHNHIVAYNEEFIQFFNITHPQCLYSWKDPINNFRLLRSLNLPVVNYEVIKIEEELKIAKNKSFLSENVEGLVLYYCSKDNKVLNIYKHKSKHYYILRTIREYFKGERPIPFVFDRFKNYHIALKKKEIQDIINFYIFCLQTKSKNDAFSYNWFTEFKEKGIKNNDGKIVIFVISKDRQASVQQLYIHSLLNGYNTQYCNNSKKSLEWFAWAIREPSVQLIIHDCQNLTKAQRSQALNKITTEKLFVAYYAPENDDESEFQMPKDEDEFECYPGYKRMLIVGKGGASKDALELSNCLTEKFELKLSKLNELYKFNWSTYVGIEVVKSVLIEAITKHCSQYLEFKVGKKLYYCGPSHVTLLHSRVYEHFGGELLKLNSMIGNFIDITIKGLCYNDEISAFLVEIQGTQRSVDNRLYHITWEKNQGAQSFKSNLMIESAEKHVITFEYKIQGTVKLY